MEEEIGPSLAVTILEKKFNQAINKPLVHCLAISLWQEQQNMPKTNFLELEQQVPSLNSMTQANLKIN